MEIRRARPEDARGIAEAHYASWRAAYEDLLPAHLLDVVQVDEREATWNERFDDPGWAACGSWVVHSNGTIGGFAVAGPERDMSTPGGRSVAGGGKDKRTGELYAIYVHPDLWGTGAGSGLMERALDHLAREGYREAVVWVLEKNDRARRFYEAGGWRLDGGAGDCFFGEEAPEVRYRILL